MNWRIALGAIGVVVLAASSWWYQTYMEFHPSARYSVPEGYSITMIQAPVRTPELCSAANERVLTPVKRDCPACKIETVSCAWRMSERERSILDSTVRDGYLITTPGMSMLLEGADTPARAACEQVAQMLAGKVSNSVACRYPVAANGTAK